MDFTDIAACTKDGGALLEKLDRALATQAPAATALAEEATTFVTALLDANEHLAPEEIAVTIEHTGADMGFAANGHAVLAHAVRTIAAGGQLDAAAA